MAGVSSSEVAKWEPMPVAFSEAVDHPLIEGAADAAALGLVFDDDEADEVAAGGQAGGHGILAREHAVEDEGHVVVFEELGDGEHAAGGCGFRLSAFGFRS